jgi:hypothetical protein
MCCNVLASVMWQKPLRRSAVLSAERFVRAEYESAVAPFMKGEPFNVLSTTCRSGVVASHAL